MAQVPPELRYFNKPSFEDAVGMLDDAYLANQPGMQPKCYDSHIWGPAQYKAALDAYWGTYQYLGGRSRFRIGVRGKVQALCALLPLCEPPNHGLDVLAKAIVSNGKDATLADFPMLRVAHTALAAASEANAPASRKDRLGYAKRDVLGQLKSLITTGKERAIPDPGSAENLLVLVAGYMAGQVARRTEGSSNPANIEIAFKKIQSVLAKEHARPSECAYELAKALTLTPAARKVKRPSKLSLQQVSDISHIEPGLREHVRSSLSGDHGDSALDETIAKVTSRLAQHLPETQEGGSIIVLGGGAHVGKKAVVGDVLVRIYERSDSNFALLDAHHQPMPIFATNARRQDYLMLTLEVLVFLERYNGVGPMKSSFEEQLMAKRTTLEGNTSHFTLEYLLEQIDELLEKPAFFIFTDVEGSRGDSVLKVIRNYGINRLLLTLLQNSSNRILVTDPNADRNSTYVATGGPQGAPIILPEPTIERLRWYMKGQVKDLLAPLSDEQLAMPVSGRTLIVLSALLRDRSSNDAVAKELIRICVPENAGRRASHPPGKQLAQAEEASRILVERLLKRCEKQGLLEAIALICASEDGVIHTTLKKSLERLPGFSKGGIKITQKRIDSCLERLKTFATTNPMLLLMRTDVVYFDPEEYAFGEEEERTLWELSSDIAQLIRSVMARNTSWATLLRMAHRQIAIAARRRAQLKKMRSGTMLGLVRNAEARDVQSYVAMLASIEPSSIVKADGASSRSLRLSGDDVFTAGTTFDPRTALRFAIQSQLKEDIDRDFRLSMVSDQDELRLRLYLLPFCELGVRHDWSMDELKRSNSLGEWGFGRTIPEHMRNAFNDSELMDMMVTIALAGFHCQFPGIMRWAYKHATALWSAQSSGHAKSSWLAQIVRIRCAIVDLYIQRGRRLRLILKIVEAWLQPEALEGDPSKLLDAEVIDRHGLDVLKSWMRLLARQAELRWSIDRDDETVWPIYKKLYAMEHRLAERIMQDDPVVLSGRTARRCIRYLCNDAPIYAIDRSRSVAPSEVAPLLRQMLETNISRLRRFGGADRIGVLVDMARRHHLEGDDARALEYAKAARERVLSGSISHGGKVDVMSVNAALHLHAAEKLRREQADDGLIERHLVQASRDCKLANHLSEAVDFAPSSVTAQYLLARLEFAQHQSTTSEPRKSLSHLLRAERAMKKARHIATRIALQGTSATASSSSKALEANLRPMRWLEDDIAAAKK